MTTIQTVLQDAKSKLLLFSEEGQLEAEILLAYIINKPRSYLYARPKEGLTAEQLGQFHHCLARRAQLEPVAYITGRREFWSHPLRVTKDTFIPRPETELLVEAVFALFPVCERPVNIADLGTGSGAIALSVAADKPYWQMIATDISPPALAVARENAKHLGITNIHFYEGNWCDALPHGGFDVIVSNPPYLSETEWEQYSAGLKFEPRLSLIASGEGLDAIRTIVHSSRLYLKANGYLIIEHGFQQGAAVRKLFSASGYGQIRTLRDLAGNERVTMAQYLA